MNAGGVYFRKPIVVNKYSIYTFDIEPKGFLAIEIDGYVTEDAVRKAREVLENQELRQKMVDTNYEIATRSYSYTVLQQKLKNLIYDCIACNPENMKK
jgi:glycosyltransferase involved in cell wall biosynthesis